MSMILMAQAMKLKIGNSARKFVLIKLADNANDKGECWPSYQHIADHCELGRSTVKAHIDALVDSGFVSKFERNNGKSSNKYVLTLESGTQKERVKPNRNGNLAQPLTGSTADTSCTAAGTPLAQPLAPEPIIDPIKEPITITSPTGSTAPEGADSVCSVCNGTGVEIGFDAESGGHIEYNCSQCYEVGPTCNDGLQVVNSELTTDQPKAPSDTAEPVGQTEHEAAPADKPVKKRKTKAETLLDLIRSKSELLVCLNCVDDTLLLEWCQQRERMKAARTDRALSKIDRALDELRTRHRVSPDTAIEAACDKGWRGLEVEWVLNHLSSTGRNMSYPAQSVPRNNDPDTPIVPKTIQRQAMSDEEIARQRAELARVMNGVE